MQKTLNKSTKPILIIGALFFVFGFITWLNSVLIPYLKIACELSNFESYLVAFSFYISYLVMAIPSSWVLKIVGFKKGMTIGLLIMAIGALVFIPAAYSRTYLFFLIGLFIQGTGLALLQTASNPYITILGPAESAAKRISIMGVCNKIAGVIAPIVLGAITLKDADRIKVQLQGIHSVLKTEILDELASRVILPYALIVITLLVLALVIHLSGLPEIDTNKEDDIVASKNFDKTSIFQFPHLLFGVLAMFLYVGAEVIAGDTIISFGAAQGIALSTAKFFTSCTLIAMITGYLFGIVTIPKYFTQENALKFSAILGLFLVVSAVFTKGYISVACIALLGLTNSLMWPSIFPLSIAGLGRFTKLGSSFLIMGIAGGAILPLVYGYLTDVFNPHQAYWILLPCYLFILFFATRGHKFRVKPKMLEVR